LVCKHTPSKISRHHALNDIISRAFCSARVPAMKEPTGLSRSDGRRPDGLTLIPWQNDMGCHGRHHASRLLYQCFSKFCWCCCQDGGLEKISQVCGLVSVIHLSADSSNKFFGYGILHCTGRKIGVSSGDDRDRRFLFQRLSMALQRYNAILLHESFEGVDDPDL